MEQREEDRRGLWVDEGEERKVVEVIGKCLETIFWIQDGSCGFANTHANIRTHTQHTLKIGTKWS